MTHFDERHRGKQQRDREPRDSSMLHLRAYHVASRRAIPSPIHTHLSHRVCSMSSDIKPPIAAEAPQSTAPSSTTEVEQPLIMQIVVRKDLLDVRA
jgi:hypothetical protein